ncbi:MAG: hypothetical protein QOJ62_1295 [Actinomycetota bacterium]|nr:hypothetical protein [Actinomycetota bacterium]
MDAEPGRTMPGGRDRNRQTLGGSQVDDPRVDDGVPLRIGFAICDPGLSFGAIVGLGARERAAELGVDLTVVSVFTPAEQGALIERFVGQAVDAIIVEAVESEIVLPAIDKATSAGIPVVIADMRIRGAKIACTVRSDNIKGAELAAAYLVDQLDGHGTIAHLQGLLTSANGLDRTRGFHNVIDRYPGIEIVCETSSEWTREAGASAMREVLAQHPHVQAVFANNDPLALGAIAAIDDAGLTGRLVVAGYDALPDALLAIGQGKLGATVRQMPREIGRCALEMAVKVSRKETVPVLVQTEVALVTADSVAEASLTTLPLFPRILRDLAESGAALAEERSLLRTLIDNLPELIYVKDPACRFMLANPAALRHLGATTPEEVVGKADSDFFTPRLAAQYRADEQAVIDSGQPLINHEEPSIDALGRKRWFSTTKVLARDSNGTVVGLVGMSRDVTELKELQAQLLQAQKMEAIGRLAGGVAHDFNNMLVVINGVSALLLKRMKSDDPLRDDLEQIRQAGERAADLTSRLLAFGRQEVIRPTSLNLNDVVGDVQPMVRRLIGENVELETRLAPSLSPVMADAGQLQQLVLNLALNARDAMPGGGHLVIETTNAVLDRDYARENIGVAEGPRVLLRVTDDGIGMDAAIRARAFEPFFTTKEAGRGTGLGLATVFGTVQQSGGHIAVRSAPGEGSTFEIYLPPIGRPVAETPQSDVAVVLSPATNGETILLVEDEPGVRQVSRRFLEKHGYRVLDARDGAEALRLCELHEGAVDLVITDVVMPGMSGPELAAHLARIRPNTPVLYVSGYIDGQLVGAGLEADVPLLRKPFDADVLATKVRQTLDLRSSRGRA